ncbi:IS6 family transposase [Roseovarius indicus]|uniref:Transposase n=2 Tax=Roseovarius indicus TaxID=540747 RepID=A0A0T5PDZ4_9RHOB|nr:IS6 family transposase [Roseovarius indicus]KRS19199.1 transposase [Roseovarius indicus]
MTRHIIGRNLSGPSRLIWLLHSGPTVRSCPPPRRVQPSGTWHLDEVFVRIRGKRVYLWRAVDDEGEVLEVLAQSRRNKRAALNLTRKLLKKRGYVPDRIVTDKLGSYSAALRELGLNHLHVTGGRSNNRAEVSHQPTRRRERRMGRFKSPCSMQRFLAVHDAIYNQFNLQRHLISRRTLRQTRAKAMAEWHQIVAA